MENQDHRKLNHTGSEGVHVCHKCGWPFPNAHPSARHRRAHKRVCGTVEGFRLDNVSQDKLHTEGSDGEHNSDDELKTPSDKATISRRSSSGVGSRSSRSNRSEDDMFTDAVTEFNESPAPVVEEAYHGGIQRFYSMQNETEFGDIKPAEGYPNADDLCAPAVLEENLLPTGKKIEVENGIDVAASQEHISASAPLTSAVVTMENENALDRNTIQASQLSSEMDIISEKDIEIMLNKNAELRNSYGDEFSFSGDASDEQKGANDELLQSDCASGVVKPILKESDGVEADTQKPNDLDSLGKDEIEGLNGIDSPGDFHSPALQVIESGVLDSSKPDELENCETKISGNDSAHVVAVPEPLPLQEHSEVAVENLGQTDESNTITSAESTVASLEYAKACNVEESGSDFVSAADSDNVFSDNAVFLNVGSMEDNIMQEDRYESATEQKMSQEAIDIPDVKTSNGDINLRGSEEVSPDLKSENVDGKDRDAEEQKSFTTLDNVLPEGVLLGTARVQETISDEDYSGSKIVNEDEEHVTLCENNGTTEHDSAVRQSMFTQPANDEVPSRVEHGASTQIVNEWGGDKNRGVEDAVFRGKEGSSGGELENESTNAETGPNYNLSLTGFHNSIDDSKEPGRNADDSKLDMSISSRKVMEGHSQGNSLFTLQSVGEVENSCEKARHEECIDDNDVPAVLRTDDHLDSTPKLEMVEEAASTCEQSAAYDQISRDKFAESTSCNTQGDSVIKQDVVLSTADTVADSGSQADSLDGNWGSISVKSAASDALPASESASNNSRALAGEKDTNLELKPVMENQQPQMQSSVKPEAGVEQTEFASEIQADEQQQIKSALQTSWSPTVAHVANEPQKGSKDKEIIAKVTNWDAGKQHTPLKTLLGEATAKSRAESPIHESQSSTSAPQMDDIPVTNNGFSAKTENVIPSSSKPEMEADQVEMGKEWNSPVRYPVNIKTEKRKAKSKPYWAPFLCCSSVNAR